jgi:uncharacterized membrane protein
MKQNRLKSPVMWMAIISQIVLVLTLYFSPEMVEETKIVMTAIVQIFTLFGILNNPTQGDEF